MSIILFSGGRGNRNLLEAFSSDCSNKFPQIEVIVNGLDDGASTGAIRELFDNNVHGISDFLKVSLAMSDRKGLPSILEERFPNFECSEDYLSSSKDLYNFLFLDSELPFLKKYDKYDDIKTSVRGYILSFVEYFFIKNGNMINFGDYKIGNIVFASMLIENNLNFQKSLDDFMKFCNIDLEKFSIIQSTEEISYLVGILKNGSLLPNEAAIVLTRVNDFIDQTFQISAPLSSKDIRDLCSKEHIDKKISLNRLQTIPKASIEAVSAIKNSDAIIYGAGTPYSSLLPSLELQGIADSICQTKCKKILVSNLVKETSNTLSASDVIDGLMEFLKKSSDKTVEFRPENYITHVILPSDHAALEDAIKQDGDEIKRKYDWITIIQSDIRSSVDPSKHDGAKLKKCLLETIRT